MYIVRQEASRALSATAELLVLEILGRGSFRNLSISKYCSNEQEAQLSQTDRAMLRVIERFDKSFKVTVKYKSCKQLEEDTGLSVGAAWIAGQDCSMWRTLRPSAGQAQQ